MGESKILQFNGRIGRAFDFFGKILIAAVMGSSSRLGNSELMPRSRWSAACAPRANR